MNMFKTQNGDILNLDYIVSIRHRNNPGEYIVALRDNIIFLYIKTRLWWVMYSVV